MNTISVEVPESLRLAADELARQEHVTLSQLVASALAEKVSALSGGNYLAERAARADLGRFKDVLSRVPDVEPAPEDRL